MTRPAKLLIATVVALLAGFLALQDSRLQNAVGASVVRMVDAFSGDVYREQIAAMHREYRLLYRENGTLGKERDALQDDYARYRKTALEAIENLEKELQERIATETRLRRRIGMLASRTGRLKGELRAREQDVMELEEGADDFMRTINLLESRVSALRIARIIRKNEHATQVAGWEAKLKSAEDASYVFQNAADDIAVRNKDLLAELARQREIARAAPKCVRKAVRPKVRVAHSMLNARKKQPKEPCWFFEMLTGKN